MLCRSGHSRAFHTQTPTPHTLKSRAARSHGIGHVHAHTHTHTHGRTCDNTRGIELQDTRHTSGSSSVSSPSFFVAAPVTAAACAAALACACTAEYKAAAAASPAAAEGAVDADGAAGTGMGGGTIGSSLRCFILRRLMKLTSCCSVCPVVDQLQLRLGAGWVRGVPCVRAVAGVRAVQDQSAARCLRVILQLAAHARLIYTIPVAG